MAKRVSFRKDPDKYDGSLIVSYGGVEIGYVSPSGTNGWYWVVYEKPNVPIVTKNSLWGRACTKVETAESAKADCKKYVLEQVHHDRP